VCEHFYIIVFFFFFLYNLNDQICYYTPPKGGGGGGCGGRMVRESIGGRISNTQSQPITKEKNALMKQRFVETHTIRQAEIAT